MFRLAIVAVIASAITACPFLEKQTRDNCNIEDANPHGRRLRGERNDNDQLKRSLQAKPTTKQTAPPIAPTNPLFIDPSPGYVVPICKKTNGAKVVPSAAGTCAAYKAINANFDTLAPSDVFGLSHFLGASLRLAFHDAGEVDLTKTDSFGPDGCLSNVDRDSAGLLEDDSPVFTSIEPLWQTVCDKISRADFWYVCESRASFDCRSFVSHKKFFSYYS